MQLQGASFVANASSLLQSLSASYNESIQNTAVPHVRTSSGILRGASPHPDVHSYVGIRYAQPPLGDLRFEPPQPYSVGDNDALVDAYSPFPSCHQFKGYTVLSEKAGGYAESEDCLFLNVWKPAKRKEQDLLPVIIWIYGGSHSEGGTNQYEGVEVVADTQDVILVSMNYRLNIFGFPYITNDTANGEGFGAPNLGTLDQRLAVKWVRDNIEAFGGDVDRMILMGQSAGGASVSLYSLIWYDDPIVKGLVVMSGQPQAQPIQDGTSWARVLEHTGCKEIKCLKTIPARSIRRGLSPSNVVFDLPGELGGGWMIADNKTFFTSDEFSRRIDAGLHAKIPTLVSSTMNEADLMTIEPRKGSALNRSLSDYGTNWGFHCPTAWMSATRALQGITQYRYLFAGTFPEINPYPSLMGAYHTIDSALWFNSHKHIAYEAINPTTDEAAAYMRRVIRNFAYDPDKGLMSMGWPRYDPNNRTLVRLFQDNRATFTLEEPAVFDAVCETTPKSGYGHVDDQP